MTPRRCRADNPSIKKSPLQNGTESSSSKRFRAWRQMGGLGTFRRLTTLVRNNPLKLTNNLPDARPLIAATSTGSGALVQSSVGERVGWGVEAPDALGSLLM
jgi:hypothetical protein